MYGHGKPWRKFLPRVGVYTMAKALHGSARTTTRLRAGLQASQESTRVLAAICEAWIKDPFAFTINPHHLIPGPYS